MCYICMHIYIRIFSLFSFLIINQRPLENQLQGTVDKLAEGLPLYMCVNKINNNNNHPSFHRRFFSRHD